LTFIDEVVELGNASRRSSDSFGKDQRASLWSKHNATYNAHRQQLPILPTFTSQHVTSLINMAISSPSIADAYPAH
jgi:hypothetical protein